ncbi:MAG: alpha/beta fold hydrolase [Deltaproteobacteria bacterium]|nr:alpha/beta fold hydrolase [Candidatus Zymogenaceae bacterium]
MADLKSISRFRVNALRYVIDGILRLARVDLVVNGLELVPDQSVIYIANHFTRTETLLVPYAIYRDKRQTPRILTSQYVFDAVGKRLLEGIGSVPVSHPDLDDIAAKSLISGESWVIFPEGTLGRDVIGAPPADTDQPTVEIPQTEASIIGLKAQMAAKIMNDFIREYHLTKVFGLDSLSSLEVTIVPVNITYWPVRYSNTFLTRRIKKLLSKLEKGGQSHRYEEKLTLESSILSKGARITVNFGTPKKISHYSVWLAEKEAYPIQKNISNPFFSGAVEAMTSDYMTEIYRLVTINPDHLIARLLSTMVEKNVLIETWEDVKRRTYLAALGIRGIPNLSFHEIIRERPESLVAVGEPHLDNFFEMGKAEGFMAMKDGRLSLKKRELKWHDYYKGARVLNTIEVITNEIKPLTDVTRAIEETLFLDSPALAEAATRGLVAGEQERYVMDWARFYVKGESKEKRFGMPKLHIGSQKVGVLLVHGYMASPEEMRPLYEYLTAQGLTVYNVRLAGHGTSPYDLTTRSWEEWFYTARIGYTVLTTLVDKIFICGFSMGGALSWHLAAANPPKLAGIVSISAAMILRSRASFLAPFIDFVDYTMKLFGMGKTPVEFIPNHPENPHINYFKNPVHGVDQLLELVSVVRKELPRIMTPALIIQGGKDPTVDPESAEEYYDTIASKTKGLVWVDSPYHGIIYRGSDVIFDRIYRFITDPAQGVVPSHHWISA